MSVLKKLNQLHILKLPALLVGVGLIIFAVLMLVPFHVPAQAQSTLTLSNIQVSAITNNSATITWTSNAPADSKVNYGLTSNYGLSESNATPVTNHAIIIGGLQASTVYHFQVVSTDGGGNTSQSQDRTLTTSSGSTSDTTPPSIFNVRVDAINTSATVTFVTNEETGVRIEYGTTIAYGSTVDLSGTYLTNHNVTLSPLTGTTTYHYRITATDRAGNSRAAGDFSFVTSGSAFDHTFTTGNCSDGTDIGQCNAAGQFCDNGTLIYNCTQCGFSCSAGQTCRVGGVCIQDPPQSGSAYECNPATCYSSQNVFVTPAPAGCYASWDRCNANIVLKVQRDRVCDKWLTCETGTTVINKNTGKQENLCYNLGGCNQLGPDGQCSGVLTKRQCNNDPITLCNTDSDCPPGGSCIPAARYCSNIPSRSCIDNADCPGGTCVGGIANITYRTPDDVSRIKNLSGAVVAGLDWAQVSGSPVIQGYYPWSVMPQLGGKITVGNASFEEQSNKFRCDNDLNRACVDNSDCVSPGQCVQALVYSADPWVAWSPTNLYNETGVVIQNVWDDNNDVNSANRVLQISPTTEEFSGAAMRQVSGSGNESYFVTLSIKSSQPDTKAIVQFDGSSPILANATVELGTSWQRITIGPARNLNPNSVLRIMCYNDGNECGDYDIFIDNIQIRPILEIRSTDADSSGSIVRRVAPSCRLYPRGDSQACEYIDNNGVSYRGWYGYCLEEWPIGSGNCISWWPVDLIKGEFSVFGDEQTAGYQGRTPLYYCLESSGRAPYNQTVINDRTISLFNDNVTSLDATAPASNFHDYEIGSIRFTGQTGSEAGWRNVGTTLSDADVQGLNNLQNNNDVAADRTNFWQGCWYRSEAAESSSSFKCLPDQVRLVQDLLADGDAVHFDNNPDIAIFRVKFNDTTGALERWNWWLVDDSSGSGTLVFDAELRAKEICTSLVQVAKFGENRAWAQRVNEGSSFLVPDLNYSQKSDLAPFGGAVNVSNITDPSTWFEPLFAEQPSTELEFPYQVRSGSPYACVGNCNQRRCMGGKGINTLCSTSQDCTATTGETGICVGVGTCSNAAVACTQNAQCPSGGTCIGGAASNRGAQAITRAEDSIQIPQNTFFSQRNIVRLFAEGYGLWRWDYAQGKYVEVGTGTIWEPPLLPCPIVDGVRQRPAVGQSGEYCAIPPEITNFVIGKNNAKTINLSGGGGTVEFRFTVNLDAQQVPLRSVKIDWDGSSATQNDIETFDFYPQAPKASLSDPHIITKAFTCTNTTGCQYTPKIQIVDNWGWCSGALIRNACPIAPETWYPSNGGDIVTVNISGT